MTAMSYLARLDALDIRSTLVLPAANRIALLTGQSSLRGSRLSSAQSDFLRAVAPPHADPLLAAFPFHPDFDGPSSAGILAASCSNGLQFLCCLASLRFRRAVGRALQPLFSRTSDRLYLVTGSCGLQLLAGAWPLLEIPRQVRVTIVSVGPAMLRPFSLDPRRVSVIQGHSDSWSRMLYRGPVNVRCEAGHMEYWQSADARRAVARLLHERSTS